MDVTTISRAVVQLKTDVLNKIHHSTLRKYLPEPTLRDRQLFFMLLPLLNENVSNNQLNIAATTVSIVHASLDEHAKIKEQQAVEKEQQLTVLSGDYYSGRYYELLAYAGNVELIRQMSRAIVLRCEHEIKVYENNRLSIEQWVQTFKVIESALIERFFYVFKFDRYTPIVEMSLTIERIQHELHLLELHKPTTYMKKMLSDFDKPYVEQQLALQCELLAEKLQEAMASVELKPALKQFILKSFA
jgi:heptaprenyl diphosphate synthase